MNTGQRLPRAGQVMAGLVSAGPMHWPGSCADSYTLHGTGNWRLCGHLQGAAGSHGGGAGRAACTRLCRRWRRRRCLLLLLLRLGNRLLCCLPLRGALAAGCSSGVPAPTCHPGNQRLAHPVVAAAPARILQRALREAWGGAGWGGARWQGLGSAEEGGGGGKGLWSDRQPCSPAASNLTDPHQLPLGTHPLAGALPGFGPHRQLLCDMQREEVGDAPPAVRAGLLLHLARVEGELADDGLLRRGAGGTQGQEGVAPATQAVNTRSPARGCGCVSHAPTWRAGLS